MHRRPLSVLALALVLSAARAHAPAHADDGVAKLPPEPAWITPTRKHLLLHALVDAVGAALYLTSETAFKSELAASQCTWCVPLPFDAAVRDAVVWRDVNRANWISTVTGYVVPGAVGLTALYLGARDQHGELTFLDDAMSVADVAVAVGLTDQAAKFAVGRARPGVYFAPPGHVPGLDDNTAFFSGHAAISWGITVATARAAQRHGYHSAWLIWAIGGAASATTCYLRMAADKHYLSDVLVGAGVGSAIGWYLPPFLHDHIRARALSLVPAPGGLALAGVF